MTPRLSGQTSIFGVVFFVSKSLLGIEGQKKLEKFAILTRAPRSHAIMLIYRTWPIKQLFVGYWANKSRGMLGEHVRVKLANHKPFGLTYLKLL